MKWKWRWKIKPFDLEKALSGHPVITRNGNMVLYVAKSSNQIFALFFDGSWLQYTSDGRFKINGDKHGNDLFMNVYEKNDENKNLGDNPIESGVLMMKPFNLKQALNGNPVITRNGRKIVEIYKTKQKMNKGAEIFVILENGDYGTYQPDGSYFHFDEECTWDLFMDDSDRLEEELIDDNLEPFDLKKSFDDFYEVVTRLGDKVVKISYNIDNKLTPIETEIKNSNITGDVSLGFHKMDGTAYGLDQYGNDLFLKRISNKYYVNVYKTNACGTIWFGCVHKSMELAKDALKSNINSSEEYIKTIEITDKKDN